MSTTLTPPSEDASLAWTAPPIPAEAGPEATPAPRPAAPAPAPKAQLGPAMLLGVWLLVVLVGMGLVIYGFGPFFHARYQRSLLSSYRIEVDHAAAAGGGISATKPPHVGDAVAILEVNGIGFQEVTVEGVSASQTRRAVGHVPGTAGPGQPGNSVFVGRRAGFGASFSSLRDVPLKASIILTTTQGQSVYEVTSVKKVDISKDGAVDALEGPSQKDQLTLITSASPLPWAKSKATVVVAELRGKPYGPTPQNGRSDDATGVRGDQGALAAVILALVAYGAIMTAAVLLHRRLSVTTAYILAVAPVLALTIIAAETVSRLFPAWM